MQISEIEAYLKLQKIDFKEEISEELEILKSQSISANNEMKANYIWCLQKILYIQETYVNIYNKIKSKEHYDAWLLCEHIEIAYSNLVNNVESDIFELYNLNYIIEYTNKIQELYPYRLFTSRETLIKEERCSICNEIICIRNRCPHKVGKLYMGELCVGVVTDLDFLAISIVQDPFDKYAVLSIDGAEYSYELLDYLFERLKTPYDIWDFKIEKRLKNEFIGLERNDRCACGSGKKYKKCCLPSNNNKKDHYLFTIQNS